ncbi:hypothetical protein [Streptosporangium sp. KLBMP 9127]|nr:hypothetical protein [Streptosporangium sp. KLBMP 9127]
MEIVAAVASAAVVLFGADRLLLWLESQGHVNWRRRGRPDPSVQPDARLDSLLGRRS